LDAFLLVTERTTKCSMSIARKCARTVAGEPKVGHVVTPCDFTDFLGGTIPIDRVRDPPQIRKPQRAFLKLTENHPGIFMVIETGNVPRAAMRAKRDREAWGVYLVAVDHDGAVHEFLFTEKGLPPVDGFLFVGDENIHPPIIR